MKTAHVANVIALLSSLALPLGLQAQAAIGIRYGQGVGSANYTVGEVNLRVRAMEQVHGIASFQTIGGNWDCPADPVGAINCGYDGSSLTIGGALAAFDSRQAYLALGAGLGGFRRNSTFSGTQYDGDLRLTANAGIHAEVTVWGPLRLQARVAHHRIFDEEQSTFDGAPHFTSLTAGLSVLVWRGGSS